jgi:hypothetical protein
MKPTVVHLPPEGFEALQRLANDAVAVLSLAGLAAWREDEARNPQGGVQVGVDAVDDAAGGVLVTWMARADAAAVVNQALAEGNYTHPEVTFAAGVLSIMGNALQEILKRAGFDVVEAPDISGAQALIRLPRG